MKTPKRAVADAAVNAIANATAKPAPSAAAAAEGGEEANDGAPEATSPVSGLTPTKDPVRNAYGLELDRFGLPVNGPARAAVLAGMEASDPALEPGEWDFRDGDRAAEVMENIYG
jgi:hypothetical protein